MGGSKYSLINLPNCSPFPSLEIRTSSLSPDPPHTLHRAPTFGVEVHAQPGSSTLGFEGLQVLPDKHILYLINNGQNCPARWTQRKPMSGGTEPPCVDRVPSTPKPPPFTVALALFSGSPSLSMRVHVTVWSVY